MRLFWELTKRSFHRYLAYRAAALAGLATNFFFGLIRVAVLLALFGEMEILDGMTRAQAITYSALSQAIIAYMSLFGWYDLMTTVHTGDVSADLLKPMNYFLFWLAQDLGRALVGILLRGITIIFIFELIYDLVYPQTAVHWLAFILTVALSWLVGFAYRFLTNLAAFWSPNAKGIIRFGFLVSLFFSGFLMPLRFFPVWVNQIAYWTPFPHMVNSVVEIYLGTFSATEMAQALLMQLVWAVGLIVIGQIVLRHAVRRLVILGG